MILGKKEIRCGLIGEKLSHSFSPQIHAHLCDYSYTLFELKESEVGEFVRSNKYDATNVTIPYKKTVMPFLDVSSPEALAIGAVNNPTAKLAVEQLDKLKNCEVHSTVILADRDEKTFKALGMHVTCEPQKE